MQSWKEHWICVVYRRTSAWVGGVLFLVLQWMKNIHKIWSDISFWLGNVGVWFKSSKSSLHAKHNTHCSLPLLIKTGLAQVKHPILRTPIGPQFLWKYEIPRAISCHKRKWLSRDLNWVSSSSSFFLKTILFHSILDPLRHFICYSLAVSLVTCSYAEKVCHICCLKETCMASLVFYVFQ